MTWEGVVTVSAAVGVLAVLGGAVVAVVKGIRWLWAIGRRTGHFLDDWNGEEARDGNPGRAGVLARLSAVEKELKPNGGTSLRDAVGRLETSVSGVSDQVVDVADQAATNGRIAESLSDSMSTLDGRVVRLEKMATHYEEKYRRRRRF